MIRSIQPSMGVVYESDQIDPTGKILYDFRNVIG